MGFHNRRELLKADIFLKKRSSNCFVGFFLIYFLMRENNNVESIYVYLYYFLFSVYGSMSLLKLSISEVFIYCLVFSVFDLAVIAYAK